MRCELVATFFCILLHSVVAFPKDNFRAERLAIDFNLPALAENQLRNYVLYRTSESFQARKLLAEVHYLKHDFDAMSRELNLIPKTYENAYLSALHTWYAENRIQLLPLIFHSQSHNTGRVLSNYNVILYEPVHSIQWAHFWSNMKPILGKDFDTFYRLALGMKFSLFPVNIEHCTDIETVIPLLYGQRRFKELISVLQQRLRLAENKDKPHYFLWLLRTKHALNEPIEIYILNSASFIAEQPIEVVDSIFAEWMSTIPTPKARVNGLKNFCKISKTDLFLAFIKRACA